MHELTLNLNDECLKFSFSSLHEYYELEYDNIQISITEECIQELGLKFLENLLSNVWNKKDCLIDDFCNDNERNLFNYYNNEIVPTEPESKLLSRQEFRNNFKLRSIHLSEQEENNFTGDEENNCFVEFTLSNNWMFGSGTSWIQLKKDGSVLCFM